MYCYGDLGKGKQRGIGFGVLTGSCISWRMVVDGKGSETVAKLVWPREKEFGDTPKPSNRNGCGFWRMEVGKRVGGQKGRGLEVVDGEGGWRAVWKGVLEEGSGEGGSGEVRFWGRSVGKGGGNVRGGGVDRSWGNEKEYHPPRRWRGVLGEGGGGGNWEYLPKAVKIASKVGGGDDSEEGFWWKAVEEAELWGDRLRSRVEGKGGGFSGGRWGRVLDEAAEAHNIFTC